MGTLLVCVNYNLKLIYATMRVVMIDIYVFVIALRAVARNAFRDNLPSRIRSFRPIVYLSWPSQSKLLGNHL